MWGAKDEKSIATSEILPVTVGQYRPCLSPIRGSASSRTCPDSIIVAFPTAPHSSACPAPQSVVENSRVPRYNTIHAGYIRPPHKVGWMGGPTEAVAAYPKNAASCCPTRAEPGSYRLRIRF